jgi:phosphate transport system substrate-binding protein
MFDRGISCPHCSYDANPIGSTHCQICGTSLEILPTENSQLQQKRTSNVFPIEASVSTEEEKTRTLSYFLLPIALLAVVIGSGIFAYRDRFFDLFNLFDRVQVLEPDIKLYRSVRDVRNVPRGLFRFSFSLTTATLHKPEIRQIIEEAHPEFELQYAEPPIYLTPGSTTSAKMLLDGAVAFAELTRPLQDSEYAKARERGFKLQQIPFALDGITFFVNPSLPVDRLRADQLRNILLGKITNWQQVGGPNLPIVPFVLDPKAAPAVLSLLLDKSELNKLGANVKLIRDYTSALRQVAATPGGISYTSAALAVNQRSVRFLSLAKAYSKNYVSPFINGWINERAFRDQTYPLIRRLFIAIRRDNSLDEQAGIAYINMLLSDLGQKEMVEKAGFVSIR